MGEQAAGIYSEQRLRELQQEVAALEQSTNGSIAELELQLGNFECMDDDWSSRLDTIEIYAMEEAPSLKESIRKICPVPV